MDLLIEAFSVIAVFAAIHERVLEALRSLSAHLKERPAAMRWLDILTIGGLSWVSAVLLALATKADLFALFPHAPLTEGAKEAVGGTKEFFTHYLTNPLELAYWKEDPRRFVGCVLMGFTTTLGSQFWHDVVKSLVDIRTNLRSLPEKAHKPVAPQVSAALGEAASQLEGESDDALKRVAQAMKTAATATSVARPAAEEVTHELVSNALVQAAQSLSSSAGGGAGGSTEPIARALRAAAEKTRNKGT